MASDNQPDPPLDDAIQRARLWLRSQQGEDGGWRSVTYGGLRSGVGTTAIVLAALIESGDISAATDRVATDRLATDCVEIDNAGTGDAGTDGTHATEFLQRGVAFLTTGESSSGLLVNPQGESDSPLYATALLLAVLKQHPAVAGDPAHLILRLTTALRSTQRIERNGFSPPTIDAGGWSAEPGTNRAIVTGLPANLSVTAHVLHALHPFTESDHDNELRSAAGQFLRQCRGWTEGPAREFGYAFTPDPESLLNKRGHVETARGPRPRGYHPPTCDAIIALQACLGTNAADVTIALSELAQLPVPSLMESMDEPVTDSLAGLYFYDAAALALVSLQTRSPGLVTQLDAVRTSLLSRQRPEGFWVSPHGWMREQDPLIATSLATLALARLRATRSIEQ